MTMQWRKLVVLRAVWGSKHATGGGLTLSHPSVQLTPSLSTSIRQASTSSAGRSNKYRAVLCSIGSVAGLVTALHYCTSTNRVYCRHAYTVARSDQSGSVGPTPLPPLTLYEYPACPFCSKVRAFCDYHNIAYTAVSVNPVSRKEIEFSQSKKLPLVVVDGQKIRDSSLVVSVLQTSLVRGLTVSECLQFYPLVNITTTKGENTTERSNKYFIMYGEQKSTFSVGELREEREWRQWVDDHLVHSLPPNIYRSLSEARQTMAVVSGKSSMTSFQRFLARNVGSVALYFVGKRNAKKYDLKPNVRESLYHSCNQWVDAIGNDRQFMGGSSPNLADLAMYGAINATEGLDTFKDIHTHTQIGPWYSAMRELVNRPKPM